MKIKVFCVMMLLCAIIGSSALTSVVALPRNDGEIAVAQIDAVKKTRFLNMLNHNRVYNDAFLSVDEIVNESVIGLLSLRDSVDSDFIAEGYVKDFVYSMYGIDIVDMSELNPDMPKMDGYVYIVPRGYSEYKHEFVSARINEDGTYTVITDVTVFAHDGEEYTCKAVSLIVANPDSQYGYNIISSEIIEDTAEI